MKKLYHATMVIDALFVSEEKDNILSKAKQYLSMEGVAYQPIDVIEVPSPAHIPKEWANCNIYGVDKNKTAQDFFNEQEEYQEYLRLKAKFEH